VSKLFVEWLDEQELAVLETSLRKVIVDCTFRLRPLVRTRLAEAGV